MFNFNQQFSNLPQNLKQIQSNKDKTQVYKVIQQIGQGTEGTVFLGQDMKQERVAIKFQYALNQKETLEQLSLINFTNIINIKEIIYIQGGVFIIMDYAHGDLYKLFETEDYQQKSNREKTELFLQIVQGVEELHQQKMIHRDLKPENVLYIVKQNQSLQLKLCDFGLLKYKPQNNFQTANIGTPYYWAPEIVSKDSQAHYTENVDIWALGMIWIEMLTGKPLFHYIRTADEMKNQLNLTQNQLNDKIDNLNVFSKEEKEILKQKILLKDESQRRSAKQIRIEIQNLITRPPFVMKPTVQFPMTNQIFPQSIQPQFINNQLLLKQSVQQPYIQNFQENNFNCQNQSKNLSNSQQPFQTPQQQLFQKNIQEVQGIQQPRFLNNNSFENPKNISKAENIRSFPEQQFNSSKNSRGEMSIQNQTQMFNEKGQNSFSSKETIVSQNLSYDQESKKKDEIENIQIQKIKNLEKEIENKNIEIEQLKTKNEEQLNYCERERKLLNQRIQELETENQNKLNLLMQLKTDKEQLKSDKEQEKILYRMLIQLLQQQSNYLKNCLQKTSQLEQNKELLSFTQQYSSIIRDLEQDNKRQIETADLDTQQICFNFLKIQKKMYDELRKEKQQMKSSIINFEKQKQLEQEQEAQQSQFNFIETLKQKTENSRKEFNELINEIASAYKYQADSIYVRNLIEQSFKLQRSFEKKIILIKSPFQSRPIQSTDFKDFEQKYTNELQNIKRQIQKYLGNLKNTQQEQITSEIQNLCLHLGFVFKCIDGISRDTISMKSNLEQAQKSFEKIQQQHEQLQSNKLYSSYDQKKYQNSLKETLSEADQLTKQTVDYVASIQDQIKVIFQSDLKNQEQFVTFMKKQFTEMFEKALQINLNSKQSFTKYNR